eukprot:EG_transcript_3781
MTGSQGPEGTVLALPPYVETIPGALTFLMAEFKKFIAERLILENEKAVAQEALALLTDQHAVLQRREAQLQQDLRMIEYALEQERLRTHASSSPKPPTCDASIQVFLPLVVNPPAPPRPKSPSRGPGDPGDLQRTPSMPLDSPSRRDTWKSPRHVAGNCVSGKKKRPFPLAGLDDHPIPAAPRATPEPDVGTQAAPQPTPPPTVPHRPKPKGKPSPGGLVRAHSGRQPSPPPEHPAAKAPLRYPLDLAADEVTVGPRLSPPQATDSFLLLSPEPRLAAWAFSSVVTPSPTRRASGSDDLPHAVLQTSIDGASPAEDSFTACDISSSSSTLRDPDSPSSLPLGDYAPPVRLEYGEESPQFSLGRPVGSMLHITRREEPATGEFDLLNDQAGMFAPALQGTPQSSSLGRLWRANLCLYSHFDTARCLAWHPANAYLLSGSDDHTLRLWNLNPWVKSKGVASTRMDLTPMAIYRGHAGPVTECALLNDCVVSASCDGTLRVWPLSLRDAQQPHLDLLGHSDAIWSVDTHPTDPRALSSGADGLVCFWDWSMTPPLLQTFSLGDEEVPTCARFDPSNASRVVVAYRDCTLVQVDLETNTAVCRLDGRQLCNAVPPAATDGVPGRRYCSSSDPALTRQINKLAMHPSAPLCFTAHEDGLVKLWDLAAGKLVDCIVAHSGHVADVAVHTNAGMMATAGNGPASLRIWDLNKRAMLEEIAAHDSKRDEAAACVRWHGARALLAAGGADATVQVLALR